MKIHNFFSPAPANVCVSVCKNVKRKQKRKTNLGRSCFRWLCFFLLLIVHIIHLISIILPFLFQFMYPPSCRQRQMRLHHVGSTSHCLEYTFGLFLFPSWDTQFSRGVGETKSEKMTGKKYRRLSTWKCVRIWVWWFGYVDIKAIAMELSSNSKECYTSIPY